ncbi:MAG: M23 family metallopeptidase [Candidatus Daviesbacteria bacterium]|nr:M23 family metallopeptidase [Candidatus Daviesbacteria bacterium]
MLKIGLVILVLGAIGAFVLFNLNSSKTKIETKDSIGQSMASLQNDKNDENEPPLRLKSIGIEFSDFKFTKEKLQFNRLFMDYGFFIPASSASADKKNPQPTFILPLGTKVRSLVDGIVVAIPTVWSGDFSVMVGTGDDKSSWRYETEHVKNVLVKVGDKVKAGQVIAEVSDFDKSVPEGYGVVEIGILKGGNPPQHVCPFAYLDDSIKEETFKKMNAFFKSWEEYIEDQTLYEETTIPGCLTDIPIPG